MIGKKRKSNFFSNTKVIKSVLFLMQVTKYEERARGSSLSKNVRFRKISCNKCQVLRKDS